MHGTNLQLVTRRCCVCGTWFALRVDPDDLDRHPHDGVFVQFAFPYLTAAERELLFLSRVCGDCWPLICPSDPLAYS
jgi:hypothetical protein